MHSENPHNLKKKKTLNNEWDKMILFRLTDVAQCQTKLSGSRVDSISMEACAINRPVLEVKPGQKTS